MKRVENFVRFFSFRDGDIFEERRRIGLERILNRYAASTSDSVRIDKAPVSSASRRSVSSDVSPLFFLEPACILVMYYLWLSTDPRGTKPILSSTRADSKLVEVIYSTPCMQTRHR